MDFTDFIQTQSGNKIHRRSKITEKHTISILGNTIVNESCRLKGNLDYNISIDVGKYCYIGTGCEFDLKRPIRVGNYNFFDSNTYVSSSSIGSRVLIGRDCRIEGVVGDCCIVGDGVVVPSNVVIPNYTFVEHTLNGLLLSELSYSYKKIIELDVKKVFIK